MKRPPGEPPSPQARPAPPDDDLPYGRICRWIADPRFRADLVRATVIFGVYDDGSRTLFFGRAVLDRVVKSGAAPDIEALYAYCDGVVKSGADPDFVYLEIPIDPATDDIEALYAYCLAWKGSCDYGGGGKSNSEMN